MNGAWQRGHRPVGILGEYWFFLQQANMYNISIHDGTWLALDVKEKRFAHFWHALWGFLLYQSSQLKICREKEKERISQPRTPKKGIERKISNDENRKRMTARRDTLNRPICDLARPIQMLAHNLPARDRTPRGIRRGPGLPICRDCGCDEIGQISTYCHI